MFLRTTEFLWQEGHTAHSTHEEAVEEVLRILDILCRGRRRRDGDARDQGREIARREVRRGAAISYSIEAMMQNGLALQAGTSHDLGQNFGKALRRAVPE